METSRTPLSDEDRRIRLLRFSADLLLQVLMTTPMKLSEAETMILGLKKLALKLFPEKEAVFDLIYMPRFRRALREAGLFGGEPILRVISRGKFSE